MQPPAYARLASIPTGCLGREEEGAGTTDRCPVGTAQVPGLRTWAHLRIRQGILLSRGPRGLRGWGQSEWFCEPCAGQREECPRPLLPPGSPLPLLGPRPPPPSRQPEAQDRGQLAGSISTPPRAVGCLTGAEGVAGGACPLCADPSAPAGKRPPRHGPWSGDGLRPQNPARGLWAPPRRPCSSRDHNEASKAILGRSLMRAVYSVG